jgi:CheY-like chemotaxis protein
MCHRIARRIKEAQMETSKPADHKHKILVVDETADNLFLMSTLLEDEYEVVTASSGEQALQIAGSAEPPELILLDIMMPEMDGYEVMRRLRKDPPAYPSYFLRR